MHTLSKRNEGYLYQGATDINDFEDEENFKKSRLTFRKVDPMHYLNESGYPIEEQNSAPYYLPVFQTNPVLKTGYVNENMLKWKENNASVSLEEVAHLVLVSKGEYVASRPC